MLAAASPPSFRAPHPTPPIRVLPSVKRWLLHPSPSPPTPSEYSPQSNAGCCIPTPPHPPHQNTPLGQTLAAASLPPPHQSHHSSPPHPSVELRMPFPPLPPIRAITADDLIPANFMPSDASVGEKQKLPACDECRGCTTNLTLLVRARGGGVSLGRWTSPHVSRLTQLPPPAIVAAAAAARVIIPHPVWPLVRGQIFAPPALQLDAHTSFSSPPPPLPHTPRVQAALSSLHASPPFPSPPPSSHLLPPSPSRTFR